VSSDGHFVSPDHFNWFIDARQIDLKGRTTIQFCVEPNMPASLCPILGIYAEIRIRAERRLGEFIHAQKRGVGLNPGVRTKGGQQTQRFRRCHARST